MICQSFSGQMDAVLDPTNAHYEQQWEEVVKLFREVMEVEVGQAPFWYSGIIF